jgi:GT2 family glycosyltransferase
LGSDFSKAAAIGCRFFFLDGCCGLRPKGGKDGVDWTRGHPGWRGLSGREVSGAAGQSQMAKPYVSVLIDTYNHERFIEKAIGSVLQQDFPADEREILVMDDGSTDATPEIVRRFEPQLRLLRKENGGQASAFNAGIPQCKGEIVAFLDGDDWWARKKLTRVAETLRAEPAVGFVGHGIVIVDSEGREQSETLREGHRFQANSVEGGRLFRRRGAFMGTSRMTIRRELLEQIGLVPEAIEIQADEYLFTLAAVLTEAVILPDALTFYRLHEANRFHLAKGAGLEKLRDKQKALAALAGALGEKLAELGVAPEVRRTVLGYTEASAKQLRLQLDGGWPWETATTEWTLYRIQHPEAGLAHRLFKLLMLAGALVTTPKAFYGAQKALTESGVYRRARQQWLPAPEMEHIEKEWRARS